VSLPEEIQWIEGNQPVGSVLRAGRGRCVADCRDCERRWLCGLLCTLMPAPASHITLHISHDGQTSCLDRRALLSHAL
jgi:hypothetical protein